MPSMNTKKPTGTTCPTHSLDADERMLALGGVAVQRCRFPVVHPSDSTGQGSSQSLGRVDGASHGELDLLVDLAGQAPGLILVPAIFGIWPKYLGMAHGPMTGPCAAGSWLSPGS